MKTELMNITPDIAIEMLSRNSSNRKVRDNRVKFYAKQMREGDWHLTGQTISFDTNGQLLDGQHRLWAIVESDCTVPFLVVTGVEPTSAYDCGLQRTMPDRLLLSGTNLPTAMLTTNGVAIIKGCMAIVNVGTINDNATKDISADELSRFVEDNFDDMQWCTELFNRGKSNVPRGIRRSVLYSTLWALTKIDIGFTRAHAEKLLSILLTGLATSDEDAPIIGFRNAVTKMYRMPNVEMFYRLQFAVKRWLAKSTSLMSRYDIKGYDFKKLKKEEK